MTSRLATSVLSLSLMFGMIAVGRSAGIPTSEICAHRGAPFVGPCYTLRGRMTAGADNIVVRPVRESRPGVMQFVCIAAAHDLKTSR